VESTIRHRSLPSVSISKSGGWIEIQGLCHPFRAENLNHDSDASPFIRWGQVVTKVGALKNGYNGYAATKHADRLREAGFANISEQSYIWPMGAWQSTEQQKQLGEITLENFSKNLNLVGAKVIAHESAMSAEEAQSLVAEVQEDLKHDLESKRSYMSIYVPRCPHISISLPVNLGTDKWSL
jgi:hypothetical protein